MKERDTEERQIKRRKALKYLGAGAFGITGSNKLTNKLAKLQKNRTYKGDQVEITITKKGNTPTSTKTVSREWLENRDRAKRAATRLKNALINEPGVHSIGIKSIDETIDGGRKAGLFVHLRGKSIDTHIPENVEDVPVKVEKNVSSKAQACYDGYQPTLEGGVKIVSSENIGGSLCGRVSRYGTNYMLTSRHIFTSDGEACNTNSVIGKTAKQGGYSIGQVDVAGQHHDYALIDVSGRSTSDGVKDAANDGSLVGHVTEDGIDWFEANAFQPWVFVEFRGYQSCQLEVDVAGCDVTQSCGSGASNISDLVLFDTLSTQDGDSGGIYFDNHESEQELYIAAMHFGETDINDDDVADYASGIAGYALKNQDNINFNT